MSQTGVNVLMYGESVGDLSCLAWYLEHHGCHCWFAGSTDAALALLREHQFQILLSAKPLRRGDVVVRRVGESDCRAFHCYPGDESCRWLPVVARGKQSTGAPALRPSEFVNALDQMVRKFDGSVSSLDLSYC